MMGRLKHEQEQLFYEFRHDEVIPGDHLVREVAAVLDLTWVRAELASYYSSRGRPSIDPVLVSSHQLNLVEDSILLGASPPAAEDDLAGSSMGCRCSTPPHQGDRPRKIIRTPICPLLPVMSRIWRRRQTATIRVSPMLRPFPRCPHGYGGAKWWRLRARGVFPPARL